MIENLEKTQTLAETWTSQEVLRWAFKSFGNAVEVASGFGVEGMALIDIASRVNSNLRVFTIDTGFLFPETYQLIERVEKRYGISVERVRSTLTPEDQSEIYGPALWSANPDQCCALRKVEPLKEKLAGVRAWITAIRRDQTSHRAKARKVEWDQKFHVVKINPIVDWSSENVWEYVRAHDVPYNPLHDFNYPSIGCTHCTRAVRPGDDPRSGRWAGSQKTECGLHLAEPVVVSPPLVQLNVDRES
ncbi:MAG TPA: phosphoadenylyl-sulfate reductase [Terriglobales bacterium]|nr:phosphoadenylyl-sulfate reductase [Terriglobales bacterium]